MVYISLRRVFWVFLSVLSADFLVAQDPHFIQYYAFASQLNPALVGNYDGSFRATAIYRNQWAAALRASAYQTIGADVDASFLEGYLKRSKFAGGLSVYNDRSGQAGLSYLNASGTLAYHQGFGKDGNHRLSVGLQGAYIQKHIENPLFGDQFNEYNQPGTTAEQINAKGVATGDLNMGLYWRSNFRNKYKFGVGFAAYHLLQPKENFINDTYGAYGLNYMRFVVDANGEIFFGKKGDMSISPEFVALIQGKALEINPAIFYTYYFRTGFRKNNSVHVGVRYRVGDAVVPVAQIQFYNLRLGVAYDVNVSKLTATTRNQGAVEVSLSYIGETAKSFKGTKALPSRRF